VVGVLQAEPRVAAAEGEDAVHRVRGQPPLAEGLEQAPEVLLAAALEQRFLVLEVVVDGRRRVLDRVRDAAHRDALVPLAGEQDARGVHDPPAHLLPFPLPPFRRPHR